MSVTQDYKKPSFAVWLAYRAIHGYAANQGGLDTVDDLEGLRARILDLKLHPEIMDVANQCFEVLVVLNELGEKVADVLPNGSQFSLDSFALYAHKYLAKKSVSVAVSKSEAHKTLTISDAEDMQLFLAMEARKEALKTMIWDFDAICWKNSADKCRADLDIVSGLIDRLLK